MNTRKPFHGGWRKLRNQASDDLGSIHDNDAARAAGFEAALVPGSTVGTAAMPAVFAWYGPSWMDGGWYELKFIGPVYEHDNVREVAEPMTGEEDVSVRIETDGGRLSCLGRAGLGPSVPWNPELDGTRGAEEVLPEVEIGLAYDEGQFTVTPEDVASMLEAAGEDSPWYREASPWGAPVVPPEWLMDVASRQRPPRRLRYGGIRQPGMWSAHSLTLRRPLKLATPYVMRSRVADKGRSRRTVFLTHEFTVLDGQGTEVALGRLQTKWFADS